MIRDPNNIIMNKAGSANKKNVNNAVSIPTKAEE